MWRGVVITIAIFSYDVLKGQLKQKTESELKAALWLKDGAMCWNTVTSLLAHIGYISYFAMLNLVSELWSNCKLHFLTSHVLAGEMDVKVGCTSQTFVMLNKLSLQSDQQTLR